MSEPPAYLGRVLGQDGNPAGTCFQALPGSIITALHVVEDIVDTATTGWVHRAQDDPPATVVQVEGLAHDSHSPADATVAVVDRLHDLAVLTIANPWSATAPPLAVSARVPLQTDVKVTGYGVIDDPLHPERAVRHQTAVGEWRGTTMREDRVELGRFASADVLRGMSGAPLLRLSDGAVLGVVSERYNSADGWLRDSVWVGRTEDLLELLAEIPGVEVLQAIGRVELSAAAEARLIIGDDSVELSCPQLDIDVGGRHGGISYGLRSDLADVRRARALAGAVRHDVDRSNAAAGVTSSMRAVGEKLAASFLPGPVRIALARVVKAAERTTMPLRIGIEIADCTDQVLAAALTQLPWETLPTPGSGHTLALHPLITVYRRTRTAAARAIPGPLRIVVAISAPEHGGGAVLDYERELRSILAAVAGARGGAAQVHIVPFATTGAIKQALAEHDPHVLHLSAHGEPGALLLEDENGAAVAVNATDFLKEAVPAGHLPPVIALAACYTNTPPAIEDELDQAAISFAGALMSAGAAAVIGTETSVTDRYATRVFASLYRELTRSGTPEVVAALANARRAVQDQFATSADPRDQQVSGLDEWAVVTVLSGTSELTLFTRTPGLSAWTAVPDVVVQPVAGLPLLAPGEFVGRRTEQRRWPALLADPQVEPGFALVGIGGIGKTTLAAELIRRTIEDRHGLVVVGLNGAVVADEILEAIATRLRPLALGHPHAAQILEQFAVITRRDLPWSDRLRLLEQHHLSQLPVLLVLDNFEDNLATAEVEGAHRAVSDEVLAGFLAQWLTEPGLAKLLVTTRYRFALPGNDVDERVQWHDLVPLSLAETMKLAWSLPELDDLDDDVLTALWQRVGGHPRTLEHVDALLAHGRGRLPAITRRLSQKIVERYGEPAALTWFGRDRTLDAAIADAITVAADDIVLPALLETLTVDAQRLLLGVSVFREPTGTDALLFAVGEDDETAAYTPDRAAAGERFDTLVANHGLDNSTPIDLSTIAPDLANELASLADIIQSLPRPPRATKLALNRLVKEARHSSLLSVLADESGHAYFVHRWTADELSRVATTDWTDLHRRAAAYWRWRVMVWPQDRSADLHDLHEARYHLLAANEFDGANDLAQVIAFHLHIAGSWDQESAIIYDSQRRLPVDDPRHAVWLHKLGILAQERGDYNTAEQRYQQSLSMYERLENEAGLAHSYHQLGALAQLRADYNTAEQRYQQSLSIYERLGNQAGLASSYHQLGTLAHLQGDYNTAEQRYQQSLTINEQLDNQAGVASSYHQLGILAQERGDYDTAEQRYQQSLTIEERLGNQVGLAGSYGQLGMLAQLRGDYDTAEQRYQQALTIEERVGNQVGVAAGFHQLGMLAQLRSDYDTARQRYQQALAINDRIGNPAGMASGYGQLGMLAQDQRDFDTAEQYYDQALAINKRIGNQVGIASGYGQLGMLAQDQEDYDTAEQYYDQALIIDERIGNQAGLATSYSQLGAIRKAQNRLEDAVSWHCRSLAIRLQLKVPQVWNNVRAIRDLRLKLGNERFGRAAGSEIVNFLDWLEDREPQH